MILGITTQKKKSFSAISFVCRFRLFYVGYKLRQKRNIRAYLPIHIKIVFVALELQRAKLWGPIISFPIFYTVWPIVCLHAANVFYNAMASQKGTTDIINAETELNTAAMAGIVCAWCSYRESKKFNGFGTSQPGRGGLGSFPHILNWLYHKHTIKYHDFHSYSTNCREIKYFIGMTVFWIQMPVKYQIQYHTAMNLTFPNTSWSETPWKFTFSFYAGYVVSKLDTLCYSSPHKIA